jgi:membrane-associated phospholipid phosphatase
VTDRVARALSIVLHPIATLLLVVLAAAGRSRVLLLAIAIGFVPMIAVIIWQTTSRRWKNADASVPTERHVLFGASLVVVLLLAAVLWWWSPQPQAARGALAVGAVFASAWALLRWIKLSLHVAFAAFAAASLASIDERMAIAMLIAVPCLAWARVRMKRHTIPDVVAGAAVGFTFGLLLATTPN